MKARTGLAVVASLVVAGSSLPQQLSAKPAGECKQEQEPPRLPKFELTIDRARVDLKKHRLEVRMNRKASHVVIKVYDEFGAPLADEEHDFCGRPPNSLLVVTWKPNSDDPIGRIEIYGHDVYSYYKGVALIPWSLFIPHEEVNFETDKAVIRASEEKKLQDSLNLIRKETAKRKELGKITLFIAGHTDTQGSPGHNLELSRRRARAIAAWFKNHGLRLPMAYEGFGEFALLVKTADEVDEPRNRRVDYVLSVEEPLFKNSRRRPNWKKL